MTYPPPSAATDDYSSNMNRNGTNLPGSGDDVMPGPGSADDNPSGDHRSAQRRRGLRRLLHRRPPPEEPDRDADQDANQDAVLESRSAEYRALHRAESAQQAQQAQQPQQPGVSWSSARPGPARPSAEGIYERVDLERAAREHFAGLRPDAEPTAEGAPSDTAGTVRGDGVIPPFPGSSLPRGVPALSAAWVAGRSGTPGRPGTGTTQGIGPAPAAPPAAAPPTAWTYAAAPLAAVPLMAGTYAAAPLAAVPLMAGTHAAAPPTAVPPTMAPPTMAPLTAWTHAAAPPTAVPPTAVPPTAVPPAMAPPAAGTDDPDGEPLYRVLAGLAMRDLTLVESLLHVIEEMEGREADAGQLELLFRIDHLATRMRRNSENLLVLAGHDGEGPDVEPVSLLDVVRAAISEITEYSRARISPLPDVMLIGQAADDVSHILAELLDNATSKSPESAAVIVRAERTGDGTMVLSVEDAGIGIPADHLADINARLGRAPVIEAAATRHMGLYVVGRLAQRHGIRVQLRQRPYGGIVAQVMLPSRLVRAQPGAPIGDGRVNRPRPDTGRPDPGVLSVPAPPPAPEGRQAPPSPAPSPAPPLPPLAPPSRAMVPPVAPRFAPADLSGLPRRTPRQPAATNGTPAPDSGPGAQAPAQDEPGEAAEPGDSGASRSGAADPGDSRASRSGAADPGDSRASQSGAADPGDSRASQIRDDLSRFQLGQRAAHGDCLPEPHHGGGTPGPGAEPDGESVPGENDGGVGTEAGPA